MRPRPLALAALLLLPPAAAQAQPATAGADWLVGCWESRTADALTREQWAAQGGALAGSSRTVATRDGAVRSQESMRISAADGTLLFAAAPSGQPPAEFRMAVPAAGSETWRALTFENRAHDFPQVIRYRPQGRDSLLAQIEGPRGGQTRRIDYAYRRVPCEAQAPAAQAPAAQAPAAKPEDVASIDAILGALYDVISGPAGQKRDWDRMRSLFAPGARMIPTGKRPDGTYGMRTWDVEQYIATAGPGLERGGFFEREIARRTERFGNVVHAFSTYESRRALADPQPFARGINSIQLWNDGQRWWVVTVYWEGERPDSPIPAPYLTTPK